MGSLIGFVIAIVIYLAVDDCVFAVRDWWRKSSPPQGSRSVMSSLRPWQQRALKEWLGETRPQTFEEWKAAETKDKIGHWYWDESTEQWTKVK